MYTVDSHGLQIFYDVLVVNSHRILAIEVHHKCSNDVCDVYQAANKKQKYERISEKKMSTPVEVLCKVNLPRLLHH